ncbi:cytochrome P450 [Archangium violaceum]|uniref:cytochrome P450 n=1 Tax=Archangium violaceum TaxID=83451 RepID=UPI00194EF81A|nr:cytochrome P450 [Archangium violaceum]QRN92937.1 cytochrome P450 [Archangium violaceum]
MTQARLNLLDPAFRAWPYPHYARLRRESPVCQVEPGGIWAVTRYDDIMTVLKNTQVFSSEGMALAFKPPWLERNPVAASVSFTDPPRHAPLRALISRAFNTASIARLEPLLRSVAEQCVSNMIKQGEVDLVDSFTLPIPAAAIAELLGMDASMRPIFRRWSTDMAAIGTVMPDDVKRQQEIRTTISEMEEFLGAELEKRRRNPTNDLISELMRGEIEGRKLTHDELMTFCFTLLPAGLETTVNQLGLACTILLNQPELQAKVHANREELLPRFVEELLRYEPVAHGLMRITTTDATLGGVTIPKHSMVMVMLASACHDESQYPNPDQFDLTRPGPHNVGFGHGIHFCVGASLARLETRVALDVLLSRCIISKTEAPVQWSMSLAVRGPAVVPAKVRAA